MKWIVVRFRQNKHNFWQDYRWFIIVFVTALVCDGLSTVYFMLEEGADSETHPGVHTISIMLGPVAGPIVGMTLKALAGVAVAIYCRRFAAYIFILASMLSFWAAWYNIWGCNIYTPYVFRFIGW